MISSLSVSGHYHAGLMPMSMPLLLLIFLPTLVLYVALSSSMTLGTCVAALLLLLAALLYPRLRIGVGLTPAALAVLVASGVLMHFMIAGLLQPVGTLRAIGSLVPLVLVIVAGCALGRLLAAARSTDVHRAARRCFAALLLIAIVAVLGFAPAVERFYYNPVFPFTEPSHFALFFTPLLMYRCVSSRGWSRMLALLLGLAVAMLLQSLTLLLGWILVACICLRPAALVFALVALGLVATQLNLSYYVERLDLSSEAQNLSTLVYIQGWQLIGESLAHSNGWGLGFQQLGVNGSDVDASQVIFGLVGEHMNLLDGGFTFAKLTSEFGLFAFILAAMYLAVVLRAVRLLRRIAQGAPAASAALVLAHSIVACYMLEFFVRGIGYFTGTAVLLVASLWLISRTRNSSHWEAQVLGLTPFGRGATQGIRLR